MNQIQVIYREINMELLQGALLIALGAFLTDAAMQVMAVVSALIWGPV